MTKVECISKEQVFKQGTAALFFIQIFSTLSFSVLYSTLVLYMTNKLGLSVMLANSITGVFVAINFALHLLGGYLGGRFFSNRALFCLGMLAQIIGCLLLSTSNEENLYLGLAVFLTGSGLNITCINCMLTQCFEPEDTRRESAFLWNYAGMNIGFFVGYSLSGYFQLNLNYQSLFLFSSLGNLVAMLLCLYFWQRLADKNTSFSRMSKEQQRRNSVLGLIIVLALPPALNKLLHFADWANKLILLSGVAMLALACWFAIKQKSPVARDKIFAFAVLMIISTVFWTLYQIGPMGLTHFINHNVDRTWFLLTIPPQWFQNINTLCIVFGGPLLGILLNRMRGKGVQVNIPMQFALALLLIGIAFAILPIGIARADSAGLVSSGWIILSFVLQSAGELLISPIGYAMVGALAPASLQGVMMGMWMLITGVGATLSSYSSNWMTAGQDSISPLLTNSGYSDVFLKLGLLAMAVSFVLIMIKPKLRAWMDDKASDIMTPNGLASSQN